MAANATSSVFYPGMVVFLLPLPLAWSYKLYVMGHVVLAAGTAYRLGRVWNTSVLAAGVAAISYAFCGNVLFQCCNVVFLVGAAWLPLAVETSERMIRKRSIRATAAFGAVLALMVLGGDPQMAYNAGLLATLYAVQLWWRERKQRVSHNSGKECGVSHTCALRRHICRLACCRLTLLALAAACGLILAAVQLLPSIEMSKRSNRAMTEQPRNIYEVAGCLWSEGSRDDGFDRCVNSLICQTVDRESHQESIWAFSVGPWRLVEYLWPNVSGCQLPVNRRWLGALNCEQNNEIWVPSMYMGLVPITLAFLAMRLRRGEARQSWLTWCVLLSLLASFGSYGVGWLARLLSEFTGSVFSPLGGNPYGGVYWWMVVLLPGYVLFRYPAKLLVVAALGLSMLCAKGWDEVIEGRSQWFCRASAGLAAISLLGILTLWCRFDEWQRWLSYAGHATKYGPLDLHGATIDLVWAMLQAATVSTVSCMVVRSSAVPRKAIAPILLVIVAIDIGVASRWMVGCVPAALWDTKPDLAVVIEADRRQPGDMGPCRVHRPMFLSPEIFVKQSSPDRLAEAVTWERATLFPKHNLNAGITMIDVPGTMKLGDQAVFASMVSGYAVVGTQYVVLGEDETLPEAHRVAVNESMDGVSLWHTCEPFPRAWIVHDIEVVPPLTTSGLQAMRARTALALGRDLRLSALVETDDPHLSSFARTGNDEPSAKTPPTPVEHCHIAQYNPSRVEIEAWLAEPGLVVLSDQYYPGWQLTVESDGRKASSHQIIRTNRVMRGVWLQPGKHRLIYRFSPFSVIYGAVVSSLGWLALMIWGTARLCQRRP